MRKFGVRATMVRDASPSSLKRYIKKNTKVFFVETPSSMLFDVFDIAEIVSVAREYGLKVIVDNSYCTGFYQKPIKMGADISVNSLSKHISGHNDIVGGSISGSRTLIRKIFNEEYMMLGSVMHPVGGWLALQGMRTLPLRLKHSEESANYIMNALSTHPKVIKIYHPLFGKDKNDFVFRQMKGAPGLFSIEIKARRIEDVYDFVHSLRYFRLGVSWGGYEPQVFPACVFYKNANEKHTLPFNLVRLWTGLHDKELLLDDIIRALDKL